MIAWRAFKIRAVCLSAFESEIMCASDAAMSVVWLSDMMKCIYNAALSLPVVLSNDNRSAFDVINGGKLSRRTRHIKVKRLFIIECVRDKIIRMKDVSTEILKLT